MHVFHALLELVGYPDGGAAELFGDTLKLRCSRCLCSKRFPSWPVTHLSRLAPDVVRNTVSREYIPYQDPDVARPAKRYRISGEVPAGERRRPDPAFSLPAPKRLKMLILPGSIEPRDEVGAPPNLFPRVGVGRFPRVRRH